MPANFLIVGTATDGPVNVPFKPKNLRELYRMLGADYIERSIISESASSYILQFEPYSLPLNEVDSRKQYLFSPTLDTDSRRVIYFGNIGGSAGVTVDFTYTPYTGKSDLIVAAERFYKEVGQFPYVVRVGGNTATASAQGWYFEAKYPGDKYNYLGIYSTGTQFSIFGMEPNYSTKTYSGEPADVLAEIRRDFDFGSCPVVCTSCGTAMLTSGYYWFGGGTDGSVSDSEFDNFLSEFSLPSMVNHVLVLSEISDTKINTVADSLTTNKQPRMFFFPSITYNVTGSANEYIDQMNSSLPSRHNMIAAFVGDITLTSKGERITRFAAEGAAIAYAKTGGYNLTNIPVVAESFIPVLSEENLITLKSNGFIPLMRYIANDISVYEGTTLYNENSFLYSSKTAEICQIAQDYCYQFYGTIIPDGYRTEIASEIADLLQQVTFVRITNVEVYKKGEEMFVRIDGTLPNEILEISFTIKNK